MTLYDQMEKTGIIPVLKLNDPAGAVPTVKALHAGGIQAAEITFRTDTAGESIKRVSHELPDILVGAGTVLTIDQAKQAVEAGASFIVSPGFNPKIVDYCLTENIPIIPGVSCASHIEQALERDLSVVKFFPAEINGGQEAIKTFAAVYQGLRFMPTGGVNPHNIASYLTLNAVLACGGSWMVSEDLIEQQRYKEITRLSREAVLTALGFELRHIGINENSAENAAESAKIFAALFGFPVNESNSSIFVSEHIEITKKPAHGKNGHIAIGTNRLSMARNYLENLVFSFDLETAGTRTIYLTDDIAGFAVHLLQK